LLKFIFPSYTRTPKRFPSLDIDDWYSLQVAISTDDVYKSAEVVNLVTQELGGKITRQPGPIPGINTKITSFLDPDGWKSVSFL
jgi:hypothetical protein